VTCDKCDHQLIKRIAELEAKLAQVTAERDQATQDWYAATKEQTRIDVQRMAAEAMFAALVSEILDLRKWVHGTMLVDWSGVLERLDAILKADAVAASDKFFAALRVAEVADSRERIGWRDHALACKCNDPECQRLRFALEAWRSA